MAIPVAVTSGAIVQTYAHLAAPVALDASGSYDPDGSAIDAYLWTVIGKPAGSAAVVSNPAIVNPTITPDLPGTYLLFLRVHSNAEWSGAFGAAAPDTAFCEVVITTQNLALRVPAAYERSWHSYVQAALNAMDALGGLATATGRTVPVLSSPQLVPGAGGTYAFGPLYVDPAWVTAGRHLRFCCDAKVNDAAETGTVRLYNLSDSENTGVGLSFTGSVDYQHQSEILTIGVAAGNIKTTPKLYEARAVMSGVAAKNLGLTNCYLEVY